MRRVYSFIWLNISVDTIDARIGCLQNTDFSENAETAHLCIVNDTFRKEQKLHKNLYIPHHQIYHFKPSPKFSPDYGRLALQSRAQATSGHWTPCTFITPVPSPSNNCKPKRLSKYFKRGSTDFQSDTNRHYHWVLHHWSTLSYSPVSVDPCNWHQIFG